MTVFLIVGGVGLALVAAALIFGDVVDGIFDVDLLGGDLFSLAALAAFIGSFGFAGATSLAFVDITWVAVVVGFVVGSLAAWGALSVTRWLKRGEGRAMRPGSLIGAEGRVLTDIPADGFGEVRLYSGGSSFKRAARSPAPLSAGTKVWVSEVPSATSVEVQPTHPTL
ncbi:MAG: NfeD family protein [Arachnia sp.]